MSKNDQFVIRGMALLLDIVATSLVAAGAKGCVDYYGCIFQMDISTWNDYYNIGGQYFVFVASLLLIIATVAVLAMQNIIKQKLTLIIFDAVAALFCLLFAGLETYYGCIWRPEADVSAAARINYPYGYKKEYYSFYNYNQSWVAALAFYLLSTVTYAALVILNRKRSGHSNNRLAYRENVART